MNSKTKTTQNKAILLSKYGTVTFYSSPEIMYTPQLKYISFFLSDQMQPPAESHLGIHDNVTYRLPFIAK